MSKILIIDDSEQVRKSLKLFLMKEGLQISSAADARSGLDLLVKEKPDVVVTDLVLPDITGLEVMERIKQIDPGIPVIIITGLKDTESTILSIKLGAYDHLEKPIQPQKFINVIKNALHSRKLSQHLETSLEDDETEITSNRLVGNTPAMKDIIKTIGRIASNRVTVLIEGESGTGKELLAKLIHKNGVTKEKPFVAVNCSALSESLLESELFGHERGSFTGAIKTKKGKFELAEDGTIFLDEISEISYDLQVKLLRVIQEKEFERVGGEVTQKFNARIIAATNKDLAKLVAAGKFREDLYYRLRVLSISLPPLRERKEDIPALVVYFLNKINKELHKNVNKVPFAVMEMLQDYHWSGNVRELENTLLQAIVLCKSDVLEEENILLKQETNGSGHYPNMFDYNPQWSIAELEKFHIKNVLDEVSGNKQKACRVLGISKPTLYKKIEVYGISSYKVSA